MNPLAPVLTIDGPSGAGKGTISRIVARRPGRHYLYSGALYRAAGVAASWADIDPLATTGGRRVATHRRSRLSPYPY